MTPVVCSVIGEHSFVIDARRVAAVRTALDVDDEDSSCIDLAEILGVTTQMGFESRRMLRATTSTGSCLLIVGESLRVTTVSDSAWQPVPKLVDYLAETIGVSALVEHEERISFVLDVDRLLALMATADGSNESE